MSLSRLRLLLLPVAFGLPLLTGACAVPVGVAAASYGADGVSVVGSGKTSVDHFSSIVSKRDCALWHVFRNRSICEERDSGKPDPYQVNYDEPFREQTEGGVEYSPPPHAAPNAPATSWDSASYKPETSGARPPTTAVTATAPAPVAIDPTPGAPKPPVTLKPADPAPGPVAAAAPVTHKFKPKKPKTVAALKKPSPDQVASSH
jgi:hypothetical protein